MKYKRVTEPHGWMADHHLILNDSDLVTMRKIAALVANHSVISKELEEFATKLLITLPKPLGKVR